VTIEEVDDEDQDAHICRGVIEAEEDMILEEIVKEHFIRKVEMDDAMLDLCRIPDEDEDDEDEIVIFHIENGKKAHYIALTARPAS
jgi:predicted RNA-binding protein with PUA domain